MYPVRLLSALHPRINHRVVWSASWKPWVMFAKCQNLAAMSRWDIGALVHTKGTVESAPYGQVILTHRKELDDRVRMLDYSRFCFRGKVPRDNNIVLDMDGLIITL